MNRLTPFDIISRLCNNNFSAHFAGGVVRDMLLGYEPNDYDIVTNATPDQVEEVFSDRNVSVIGKSFLVAIVDDIEVATWRTDRYFGLSQKNCDIKPAQSLCADLERRDLSINSLAMCPQTGDVLDEFGGIDDLKNRMIRLTGNPEDRINEDPLRIIRACRFCAKINGKFENETKKALRQNGHYVRDYVAAERIRLEILKAMKSRFASRFFDALKEIDVLQYVLPSLNDCVGFTGGHFHNETVYLHNMMVGDSISCRCELLKLAGYLHDVGKPISYDPETGKFSGHHKTGRKIVRHDLQQLRFNNAEICYISGLVEMHMRSINSDTTDKAVRRLLRDLKSLGIRQEAWLRLKIADRKGNLGKQDYTKRDIAEMQYRLDDVIFVDYNPALTLADLEISGADVMNALNIEPGPQVGKVLDHLMNLVIDDPSLNNKAQLIGLISNVEI